MPRMAYFKIFSLLGLCLSMASCTVGPNFTPPQAPQTLTFTEDPQPEKTVSSKGDGGNAQYLITSRAIPDAWWMLFHSSSLNQLIIKGFAHSPNIEAASAALRQSQENFRAQVGNYLYPAVDLQLGAQRRQISGASTGIGLGTGVGTGAGLGTYIGSTNSPTQIFNLFNTQVNVSYTLDILGGNRRELEALCAQVNYQRYQLEGTYLSLAANIVTTAITEASLSAQIKATREIIKLEEDLLKITKKQNELGAIALTDVLTQESQLAQSKTALSPLEKSLAQTRHSLAALIGEIPSQADIPCIDLNELQLPRELPVTLPSSLVQQRPDIRASEALLRQASAEIGVATANLLPKVTLNGYYGWQANQIGDLFDASTNIWSIAGQILQPVFHGGALLAQRRAAIAAYDQSYAQYKQTVITAFQNVADALKAIELDAKALAAQTENLDAAKRLYDLTIKQYKLGAVTYLSLLNAERQYNSALVSRIQAQAARYTDTAALFQALGGGWWQLASNGDIPND